MTTQLCRSVRDADAIVVRRVDRRDLAALEELWCRCSPATLSRRFLGGLAHPSWLVGGGPSLGTPRIDLGAWLDDDLVGVGSLVRDRTGEWEAALLVEDVWQRRGIGSRLTEQLVREGRASGVRALVLTTPADSVAVHALVRRYAAASELTWQGSGVAEYRVALDGVNLPATARRG